MKLILALVALLGAAPIHAGTTDLTIDHLPILFSSPEIPPGNVEVFISAEYQPEAVFLDDNTIGEACVIHADYQELRPGDIVPSTEEKEPFMLHDDGLTLVSPEIIIEIAREECEKQKENR